jgi:hypothetical protein
MTLLDFLLKLCELWLGLCVASVLFIQILVRRSSRPKHPNSVPSTFASQPESTE